MHSELFQLGPLTIRAFGLCMALGFLFGWQAANWLCKHTGRNADHLATLLTWLMLSAILGARAAYVLEHWSQEFAHDPRAILRVDQGGLMFYGGLISAAVALLAYAVYYHEHLFDITDLVLAVVPIGHAFGRIGCFFHGCCYGRLTGSCLGVRFPAHSPAWWEQLRATPPLIPRSAATSLPVLPTQLIEAMANALLFALLLRLYPRMHKQRGFISGCYLVCYAILRYVIEELRGDPRLAVGPFSIGQSISLGIFALGLACLFYARRRTA